LAYTGMNFLIFRGGLTGTNKEQKKDSRTPT